VLGDVYKRESMPTTPSLPSKPFLSLFVTRHVTPVNFDKELFLEFNLGPQVI